MAEPLDAPGLPCPECRTRGVPGGCRIGNRRSTCGTCNRFAQHVMRSTRRALMERYAEEYEAMRRRSELELYPSFVAQHAVRVVR